MTKQLAIIPAADVHPKRKLKTPPPGVKFALKLGVIYSADNGRLICIHCAGMSALFTGRDISGQKCTAMTQDDAMEWERHMGRPMNCEGGCTTYRSIRQCGS